MGKAEFDTIMEALGGISEALNDASDTLAHWEPIKVMPSPKEQTTLLYKHGTAEQTSASAMRELESHFKRPSNAVLIGSFPAFK